MLYKTLVLVKYVNVCVYWLSPVICILLLFLEIKLELMGVQAAAQGLSLRENLGSFLVILGSVNNAEL